MSNERPPPRRTARSNATGTTNAPVSVPPQRLPQGPPASKEVPRPKTWEPVDLENRGKWEVGHLELFDEVDERFASLFDRRPKFWNTRKAAPGETLENMARTNAYYGRVKVYKQTPDGDGWSDNAGYDDAWRAQRLLGAGSFGRVGLWVRRDENNQIVDEMAIKEEDFAQISVWDNELPEETVTNEFMNRGGVENIQRLRGFKSFPTPPDNPIMQLAGTDSDRRWRYYFEYAPHGALDRLLTRYRTWNQYLPESFLWHVFDGLAKVLVTFDETGPNWREHRRGMLRAADRLVHFDIKPANIFLGYEEPFDTEVNNYGGHGSNVYPMIKMGDFGVSAMTSERDIQNPAVRFWGRGTKYYMPPEAMHYGASFPIPPNGRYLPLQNETGEFVATIKERESQANPAGIFFTQPMNVWGVGKVMYDLATLSPYYNYAAISTQNYEEYKSWGKNAIEDFQKKPFLASNRAKNKDDATPSPYSKKLMDLIRLCMLPAADDRAKAREVKDVTEKILARYGSDEGQEMNEKVYFVGNEINNMPVGVENFVDYTGEVINRSRQSSARRVEQVLDYSVDPDEPELQPPDWGWSIMVYKSDLGRQKATPYNSYWAANCEIVDGKVIFQPNESLMDGVGDRTDDQAVGQVSAPANDQVNDRANDQANDQNINQVNEQDQPAANVPDPEDDVSAEEPAQKPKRKAPPPKKKPTVAGSRVKKSTKKQSAPTKPAAKKGGRKSAAKAAANTQATNSAPAPAPVRPRLDRAAKKEEAGMYKV